MKDFVYKVGCILQEATETVEGRVYYFTDSIERFLVRRPCTAALLLLAIFILAISEGW